MRHDLLFETERFNSSEAGAHFINPNCFGEDLAAWLRGRGSRCRNRRVISIEKTRAGTGAGPDTPGQAPRREILVVVS